VREKRIELALEGVGDQIAAHGDKSESGGVGTHGLQTGLVEREGGVGAASVATLLQGLKTLLTIG
jgi:hypothetical protein